ARVRHAGVARRVGLLPARPPPAPPASPLASGGREGKLRGAPAWEALGLVYVPCPGAPLLTTRRQLDDWRGAWTSADARRARRSDSSAAAPLSASIEDAIAQAAARGHDTSGRFRLAMDWLRGREGEWPAVSADRTGTETDSSLPAALGLPDAGCWTEWEPIAGGDGGLIVVYQDALPGLALVFTALLCLIFWRMPERMGHGRLGVLLVWLGTTCLGYLWLPPAVSMLAWWPLLGGAAIALAWYLGAAVRKQSHAENRKLTQGSALPVTGVVTGGLLLAVLAGLSLAKSAVASPDAQAEHIVFLIREGGGDKLTVLAPPDLLDRLEAQARRSGVPSGKAVLVSADYEAKIADDAADFKVEFLVDCVDDGSVQVNLPLDGAELAGETLLDGARVYPAAAPAPQVGYTLRIPAQDRGLDTPHRGRLHRVSLRFRTPLVSTGEVREIQLTLPSIPHSRLTLDLPPRAHVLEALSGQVPVRGRQRVVSRPDGLRLEADLGRLSAPLRLHWVQENGTPRPAQVQAKETYLWDLRPESATLTALLRYTVIRGTAST